MALQTQQSNLQTQSTVVDAKLTQLESQQTQLAKQYNASVIQAQKDYITKSSDLDDEISALKFQEENLGNQLASLSQDQESVQNQFCAMKVSPSGFKNTGPNSFETWTVSCDRSAEPPQCDSMFGANHHFVSAQSTVQIAPGGVFKNSRTCTYKV